MRVYEFDRFRVDPNERRLFHAGSPIALAPKTLDTLIALLENAGNLLHKEVLHKLLWPDTFVEDVTLARNISDLRAVLGQHSAAKYIETVSKHGYRFIGEVHLIDNGDTISPANSEPMIGVLPFVPFDDNGAAEIFGDGLAEEIIHALSCFSGLKVAARGSCFRFRGPAHDLRKIAADLGTDFVVQGSIRRIDSRFRVTAQLIEAKRLTVRWSEQFERELGDFIEIQESIARAIVAELKPRLGRSNLEIGPSRHSRQTDAWHSLWEGRLHQHRFTTDSLTHAESCFEKAIRLDPGYALAYLGMAESQHIKANLGFARPSDVLPKAADAISKALLLESDSGDVHAAAGVNAVFWRYDWAKAEIWARPCAQPLVVVGSSRLCIVVAASTGEIGRSNLRKSTGACSRSALVLSAHRPGIPSLFSRKRDGSGFALRGGTWFRRPKLSRSPHSGPHLAAAGQDSRGKSRLCDGCRSTGKLVHRPRILCGELRSDRRYRQSRQNRQSTRGVA